MGQGSPEFLSLLDEIKALHLKKNADYSTDDNPFSNFEFAAGWAGVSVKQVFRVLEGIKVARLRQLESSGKNPLNESVRDTQMDLTVYRLMEIAYDLREEMRAHGAFNAGSQNFLGQPDIPTHLKSQWVGMINREKA